MPDEIAFALSIDPSQMDCAFALNVPYDLRHRIFRRYRQQHVHMIGHQMPFLNLRFPLERKPAENLALQFLSCEWLLTLELRWWTALNVKLLLPPRQSRGVSRLR